MTPPAARVLFAALVLSTITTAFQHSADHELRSSTKNININMQRTNKFKQFLDNYEYHDFNGKISTVSSKLLTEDEVVKDTAYLMTNDRIIAKSLVNDDVVFNKDNLSIDKGLVEDTMEFFNEGTSLRIKSETNDNILAENADKHKAIKIQETTEKQNVKFINKSTSNPKYKDFDEKSSIIFDESSYTSKMRHYSPENIYKKREIHTDVSKRRVKREEDECEGFIWTTGITTLRSPMGKNSKNYARNVDCVTVIQGQEANRVSLTFINEFKVEEHPTCIYDFIQIRDGEYGYADSLGKFCGNAFPPTITSSGPNLWLKFHSDNNIEYAGFQIQIDIVQDPTSHAIPKSCMKSIEDQIDGEIDMSKIELDCLKHKGETKNLDVVWNITTAEKTKIFLNFTSFTLAKPNNCEENYIQIFGRELEEEKKLALYCGSVANAVNSPDNIMYLRLFATKSAEKTTFNATFNAYRQLETSTKANEPDTCDQGKEFDCQDNTCIASSLKCNGYANCRLKTDENEDCAGQAASKLGQVHIQVILIIFSLILSGMCFVLLFKCIRKLYQDHKIIKEHIRQSCEDRLDDILSDNRLPLDPKKLQRNSEPRASLERDNHTNEMYKKQRSYSQRKQTSIDSVVPETYLDLEDSPFERKVDNVPIEARDIKLERNGRSRRSDLSRREESLRSKMVEEERESEREVQRREIRDVSVGAPDTKESGCQTRESLFQTETAPSSDGSNGTNSRGFSTFGYSGATIVRPSPPAPSNISSITLELLKQVPQQDPVKSQKKMPDRRPMSAETTRSAPDVIIVSKPIR